MAHQLAIPELARATDEEIEALFPSFDGRWSRQTRALMAQHGAKRLNLDAHWASVPQVWACEGCDRYKPELARLSPAGVLICRLDWHHDHLRDYGKRVLRDPVHRPGDPDAFRRWRGATDVCKNMIERFHPGHVCVDCNAADGEAKRRLKGVVHPDFSFSPTEITRFISIRPGRSHAIDLDAAKAVWSEVEEDVADRVAFVDLLARRVAEGRHQRHGRRCSKGDPLQSVLRDLTRADPESGLKLAQLPRDLEARSVQNDGFRSALKPKEQAARVPTAADLAAFTGYQDPRSPWVWHDPDWRCAACDRSRFECLRASAAGKWTGRLHRLWTYEPEMATWAGPWRWPARTLPANSRRKKDPAELEAALNDAPSVSYSDRGGNFLEGRIYHDDLLGVAHVMFRSNPMLSRLVSARFPFIFVDEYQDTDPAVIEILINHLHKADPQPVIGFFGDKVQSIYPGGVGELTSDQQAQLEIIQKEENYRCSKAVIEVLNKIRTDIKQGPAGNNLDGRAVYVNLAGLDPAADITDAALAKAREAFGIDLSGKELKVLFLTHRLIARKAGYEGLWSAYNDRSSFAKDDFQSGKDPIANFLSETVAAAVEQWRGGKTGATIGILKRSGTTLASADEKAKTKAALDALSELADVGTIGDVLRHIQATGLLVILDDLTEAMAGNYPEAEPGSSEERYQTFMETLLALPFREISTYRAVSESHLPYTTKHGVKGDEFDNVLVILDDAGANWNQYSFGNLLADQEGNAHRLTRTRNLFYVCCSRAKDTLIVAHVGAANRAKMEELFGAENLAL